MDIYCKYDKNLDDFIKRVVHYTLDLYGDSLDLYLLKEVELVRKETFSFYTDGRMVEKGRKILLTSHLYEQLDSYDIEKIKDSEIFKTIVRTIYHEMGHISDMRSFPNLYCVAVNENNPKEMISSFFWLEYLAEKRSCKISLKIDSDYCDDFVSREWKIKGCNLKSASEDNFYYLNKTLAYFLARIIEKNKFTTYVNRLKNEILKEYIIDLEAEISYLEQKPSFDKVETLYGLFAIMRKYLEKFVNNNK